MFTVHGTDIFDWSDYTPHPPTLLLLPKNNVNALIGWIDIFSHR